MPFFTQRDRRPYRARSIENQRVRAISSVRRRMSIAALQFLRAMKLTAVVLLAFSLHVSARAYSQSITLKLSHEPLDHALKLIEQKSGYAMAYIKEDIEGITVSLNVENASIDEVLKACLKGSPLSYSIEDKIVSIKKNSPVLVTEPEAANPPGNLKGIIFNEDNQPLPGTTITIKEEGRVTVTNDKGEFELTGIDSNSTVIISHIGYATQEIKLHGKFSLRVHLSMSAAKLQEVSIAYSNGYQVLPAERQTGSFDLINNQLFNREVTPDVISRLDGIASGVYFDKRSLSNNGLPTISNVIIRGLSTINANTTPLIIVDNHPYDGDPNNIDPNDVENITILKDAAAASIWGVRAGNGVVVITTKKGKLNQPLRITANTNFTVTGKPRLFSSPNNIKSTDFIDIEENLFTQGFYSSQLTDPTAPPVSPVVDLLNQASNGTITSAQANSEINGFRNQDVRNDLLKYFYREQTNQQYNISLSGGNERASYYLSTGYDKNMNTVVGDEADRFNINSNNSYHPVKNLEIDANLVYTEQLNYSDNTLNQLRTGGPTGYGLLPYAQLADAKGNPLPYLKDYSTEFAEQAQSHGFLNWQFYPLQELRDHWNTGTTRNYDIRINTGLTYKIIPGLSASVKYQYERTLGNIASLTTSQSYSARNLINEYSKVSGSTFSSFNLPNGGILVSSQNNLNSETSGAQLDFNRTYGVSQVVALAGVEARSTETDQSSNAQYGYNNQLGTSIPVSYITEYPLYPSGNYATIPYQTTVTGLLNRYTSIFGNASYTYNRLYTITVSARKDASNLFGVNANDRGTPLWSVGGKWQLSNEKFYKSKLLPELGLRATYGYSGNVYGIGAVTTIRYSGAATYTNLPQASVFNAPNNDLKWEKDGMTNFGIDFGTKDNRITGSLEYFYKNLKDLIQPVLIDPTSGAPGGTISENIANVKGNGADIQLTSRNIIGVFHWESSLLLSHYKDRVVNYLNAYGTPVASSYVGEPSFPSGIVGAPLEAVYAYKWAGLDQAGNPQGLLQGKPSEDYIDIMNDSVKNLRFMGSALPLYYGTFRNTFSYKNFSVSANISYRFSYYVQKNTISYSGLYNSWSANADYYKRWQSPGDEKKTTVPSMIYPIDGNRDAFYAGAEPNFIKGDNLRLQDISLSYVLTTHGNKNVFKDITFYGYMKDLGILWRGNKQHLDPDYLGIPPSKSFSLGVKASL